MYNPLFSERLKLEKEFLAWAEKNDVTNRPMLVIAWYHQKLREMDKQWAINRCDVLVQEIKDIGLIHFQRLLRTKQGRLKELMMMFNIKESELNG